MSQVITFLATGIFLLIAEIFLPGMVAGVLGLICLLLAVVFTFIHFGPEQGFILLFAETIIGVIAFMLWLKYFPKSKIGQKFSIDTPPGEPAPSAHPELLGQVGKALTILRPSGTAMINGQRFDVVSEGPLIEAGQDIKVAKIDGSRIVVRQT